MAPFLFTQSVLQGKSLTIFNEGKMKRDFTYVDDICSGILATLSYPNKAPEVFNLGNNQPVGSMRFVEIVEELTGGKAKINYKDSVSEIPITFANISKAQTALGYRPTTSIETGMKRFVDWYMAREKKLIPCACECKTRDNLCFPSYLDRVADESRNITDGCSSVIYTVVADDEV